MQGLIQDRSLLFSNKLQKRYLCLILWVMTNTCRPKIALVSVHRLAEHLHAMSTLKSRYKISNLALNSVHPSLVIYNKKSPDLWELQRMSRHQYTLCIQTNCNNKKWMEGNWLFHQNVLTVLVEIGRAYYGLMYIGHCNRQQVLTSLAGGFWFVTCTSFLVFDSSHVKISNCEQSLLKQHIEQIFRLWWFCNTVHILLSCNTRFFKPLNLYLFALCHRTAFNFWSHLNWTQQWACAVFLGILGRLLDIVL